MSIAWEDEKPTIKWEEGSKERTPKGSLSRSFAAAGEDVLGAVGAGMDVVGSLPGLMGAGLAAVTNAPQTLKRSPMENVNEVLQSASKGNVMEYVPGMESLRKYSGYEPMAELISQSLTVPTQGLGNIGAAVFKALGVPEETAGQSGEDIDAFSQAAALLSGLKPGRIAKAGTPEWFTEQAKLKTSIETLKRNKIVREEYLEIAKEEKAKAEALAAAEAKKPKAAELPMIRWADQEPGIVEPPQNVPMMGSKSGGSLRPKDLTLDENGMLYNPKLSEPFESVGPRDIDARPMLDEHGNPITFDTHLQAEGAGFKNQLGRGPVKGTGIRMRGTRMEQNQIPGQGELFTGRTPENPQFPIIDPMPKKVVPELGEGQTPTLYQDAFRMSEKAGEDPGMAPNPLAMGEASKPTLGPGEPTTIPYKPHLKGPEAITKPRLQGPEATLAPHVQEAIQFVTEGRGRSGLQQLADQKAAADRLLNKQMPWEKKGPTSMNMGFNPESTIKALKETEFLKSLTKLLKGETPKTLAEAKRILEAKLDDAMNRRDILMAPAYREKLKKLSQLERGSNQRGDPKVNKRQTKSETIQEDIGLVDRFKAGDSSAFTRIYEKYGNRLEKMLTRKTRDEAETADLVQDTFVRAAKALDTFDFRNGTQLFTWLYTIGQNVWKSKVTHDMSRIKTGELTPEMGEVIRDPNMLPPDKILAERERIGQIQETIDGLSENLQMAFRLKFEEELSYKEISELLNIPIGTVMSRISQARDTLAKQIAKMDREANVPRSSPNRKGTGGTMYSFPGMLFDFKKKVKEKGVVKAVEDYLKQFGIEKRTPIEIIKEEKITPESIEDFGSTSQIGMKNKFANIKDSMLTNALIDKTISILAQGKDGLGKIVKSIVDQNRSINRKAQVQIRESVEQGLPTFRKLMRHKIDRQTLEKAVSMWWDNVGKEKLQREHFPSEETYKAYTEINTMLSGVRDRVNEARAKYPDLTPLEFVENYLPGMWEGEYKVQVKDGNNVVIYQRAFNSEGQAVAMQKELKAKYPDYDVPEPFLNKPTKEGLNSLEAFEETMKVMGKDSPITHAIQKTVQEILARRSFGRHGVHKRGVEGSLGTEGGVKGLRNLEKALEQYVLQGENYIANLQKKELYGQLHELPVEIKAKIPQGLKYLNDYINQSKGVDMNRVPLVNDVVEATSVLMGQGRHGAERGLSKVMSVASIMWLATSRFFLSQPIQTANVLAKLVDLKQLDLNVANPLHSYWEGWSNSIAPDAIAKRGASWVAKNGYLESALVSMLNLSISDIHRTKLGVFGDVFKWSTSKLEHYAVRLPAFMMFEHSLRKSIPNEAARFERSAELMDYYMVHYDSSSAPLVYEKAGIVGQAAKPLKQYAHNMWGQFLEYAQTAKDQGRLAPLGTFLATQATVAGLKGTILVAEATAIVTVLNAMFGTEIPTPEELLHKGRQKLNEKAPEDLKWASNKLGEALIYGGYSRLLGVDVSSSVSAPSLPQMFSAPPVAFAAAGIKNSFNYLYHKALDQETDSMAMLAAQSVFPNALRGFIEEIFSEEGQPVPRPTDNMKGNYVRGTEEKIMAGTFSLKSISEANADALARIARKQLVKDMQDKMSAINVITDRMINEEEISEEMLTRYVEEGGDIKNLANTVKKNMMERQQTFAQRALKPGSMTPSKFHKLQIMRKVLDEEARISQEKDK